MRLGHEWCGTVTAVGDGVDPAWIGRRVMGDTMLGCGRCRRCLRGHQHVCENRQEVGIRGGRPGALAEQLAVPVTSLHRLPDTVDASARRHGRTGRQRPARRVGGRRCDPGTGVLVLGPGTIGLLVAMFARAAGAEVHLLGRTEDAARLRPGARLRRRWTARQPAGPALRRGHRRLQRAAPARQGAGAGRARPARGLHRARRHAQPASTPGSWRSRTSPRSAILSASPGLDAHHRGVRRRRGRSPAAGRRDRRPGPGRRRCWPADGRDGAGPGPKIHVDPRLPG